MANRNINIKQTKFCKFCKDSGKNESIYTSHNVKDKNGNTCCPILMTTLCNNCRVFGHTVKFCKAITPINKNNKNTLQKTTQINIEIKKKNENMNRYSVFDEDDEDDEPVKCEPEKIVKKAESIFVKYKRRVENWADECSDTDDD